MQSENVSERHESVPLDNIWQLEPTRTFRVIGKVCEAMEEAARTSKG
jgi:hypothetical protein